ncbi:hypothetical protein CMV_008064 [Castanea mollissima]|uniref:Uncharacterized protein n=1 Tax=Castanea mollissima TaxID=60419 RepID=A0A8J4RSF5_9ROSI|nr:hypothetical protein CMV_008064 [Castanea mollissima]
MNQIGEFSGILPNKACKGTRCNELSDHLWIVSLYNERLQNRLNKSNPSERNYVEVICETERLDTTAGHCQLVLVDWIKNHPRGWGVRVECICQWASNNGGGSRHQCRPRRRTHRPTYARRPQKHYQTSSALDDSGLSIAHTYVNDGSNYMLYPPSKKARKS